MSISKSLFDQVRLVPETDETGWGNEVTNQLVDLLDGADAILHQDGSDNILVRFQAASSSLAGSATLTPTSPVHKVVGSGGAVSITAIASGNKDGQLLVLIGTDNTNTVRVPYSATVLLNGDCILGDGDVLKLQWSTTASAWVEVGRNS